MDVFDGDGNKLGDIPLSERQLALLQSDVPVGVMFHMPVMLRGRIPDQSGSFTLRKIGDRVVCANPERFKQYLELQQAIAATREVN